MNYNHFFDCNLYDSLNQISYFNLHLKYIEITIIKK